MRPEQIVASVPTPPPFDGHAIASAVVLERLAQHGIGVRRIRLVPRCTKAAKGRFAAARFARLLGAVPILAYSRCRRIKVYYASISTGGALYIDVVLCLLAHLMGMNVFIHHHGRRYIAHRSRFVALMVRLVHPRHIFLCRAMAEDFEATYGRSRYTILDNVNVVAPTDASRRPNSASLVFGHLSNLSADKGLATVVEVAKAVLDRRDVRFVLAGPLAVASYEPLQLLAQRYGDRFEYRGAVYGESKAQFYREIDVFIFPSSYISEAQPLVLYEAASAGCAIVSTGIGWIPNQLDGLYAKVGREAEFVSLCLELVAGWPKWLDREKQTAAYLDMVGRASGQLEHLVRSMQENTSRRAMAIC